MPEMQNHGESFEWAWIDASYLREQAHRCARLARDCPHLATSHQLEAIGIELMQKAAELDELQQTGPKDSPMDKAHHVAAARKK